MGQLVGCIRGIGEACRALDFPVVSGNVSLYNETNGRGILPTPTIGGVGVLDDCARHATVALKREGDALILVGATKGWLGQSVYLRDVCGREEGAPPPVDLACERRNGDFVRNLIRTGQADTVHDCSDGGLAVALVEAVLASGVGATVTLPPVLDAPDLPPLAALVAETPSRVLIAAEPEASPAVAAAAATAGVPLRQLGQTGGDALTVPGLLQLELAHLRDAYEGALPALIDSGGSPRG
jgi:phosphoribosylformylglycinamidine synthase subunit PurL